MVVVRYFAGARAAAGIAEEQLAAPSLAVLVDALAVRHGSRLAAVLARCTFLVDGLAAHDRSAPLAHDSVVDVLPPFAGG